MISSIEWIPAGVANPVPQKYEMSAAERELIQLMEEQGNLEEAEEKLRLKIESEITKKSDKPKIEGGAGLPADLRMDEYSSDEEDDDDGAQLGSMLLGNSANVAEELNSDDNNSDNEDEQNMQDRGEQAEEDIDSDDDEDLTDIPDSREYVPVDVEGLEAMGLSQIGVNREAGDDDDDESDIEDVKLTADDALVMVAKTEDDFASLELHVYDKKTGNLYVHHDIPLPAFPLCLASGQVSSGGATGNFCAVGTFNPGIEVWNMDVLNALEPSCVLGGEDRSVADDIVKLRMMNEVTGNTLPTRKPKGGGLKKGSHTDAVMALSWNQTHKQVIASGSADNTVKLWDVSIAESESCNAATFFHHKGKVQSVSWHPKEGTLLATGSYDRTVVLLDAKGNGRDVKRVKIKADCEAIAWDPFHSECLTVASEDGSITCWDVRQFETSKPLWSFVANEFGGISDLAYNNHVPGLLATCSVDKTVTLWDTYNPEDRLPLRVAPRSCGSKDMCSGKLYSVSFYSSEPWLLGCGGSGNQLALWDLSEEQAIQKRFRERVGGAALFESDAENIDKGDEFDAMMKGKSEDATVQSKGKKMKDKTKRKARRRGR